MEEDLDDDEEEEVDVFPKPMAERFILRLERLETALQLTMSDVGGPKKTCNVSAVALSARRQEGGGRRGRSGLGREVVIDGVMEREGRRVMEWMKEGGGD